MQLSTRTPARASTKAGLAPLFTSDVLLAKSREAVPSYNRPDSGLAVAADDQRHRPPVP
jgi:hypothetical protein